MLLRGRNQGLRGISDCGLRVENSKITCFSVMCVVVSVVARQKSRALRDFGLGLRVENVLKTLKSLVSRNPLL